MVSRASVPIIHKVSRLHASAPRRDALVLGDQSGSRR